MKIGKFMKDSVGDMHGRLFGLGLGVTSVMFEPTTSKDGKPYFRIIASPTTEAYEVGAAFERKKNDGSKFYTLHVDSPALTETINAVLIPDRTLLGNYNLYWERPETYARSKPQLSTNGTQSGRKLIGAAATP